MATKTTKGHVKISGADSPAGFDPLLEERKVKALEKMANSIDALTLWFEEIDKEEWDQELSGIYQCGKRSL